MRALRGNYTLLDHLVGRHLIIIKSSTRCFVYFTLKFRSVDLVVEFTTTLILIAFNSLKNKDLRFIIFLVLERGLRSIARLSEMIWSRVRKREVEKVGVRVCVRIFVAPNFLIAFILLKEVS